MSNVAVFEAINMSRQQLLEESGRMLPILKEINDKEDETWQQEYYLQYTGGQQQSVGNMASRRALELCAPIIVGVFICGLIDYVFHLSIFAWLFFPPSFLLSRKVFKTFSGQLHGEATEKSISSVVVQEISRLRTEVDTLRRDHMGWMSRIFPEEMLFYDAISYIHQALRMGMVDNFKEAVNSYMQHVHQKKMEFHTERAANNAERAAIAAEQTAYEVRQLRFEEAMRFFVSG